MGTVDLRDLEGDQIVIHYGGALKSVDAYTFANSLIAFADTVSSVSNVLDPGPRIEVRVEALGEGSFRAAIRRIPTGLTQFMKEASKSVLFAYIAYLVIERIHGPPTSTEIIINSDEVVISRGKDKVILPRTVYEGCAKLKSDPRVQDSITRTFQVIEEDSAVENFGMTPRVNDVEPLVQVPREDFPRLIDSGYLALEPPVETSLGRRERTEKHALLVILKPWLSGSYARKWSFEWNGVPISAPIKDLEFLERLARREYLIGVGDALEVELRYMQDYDEQYGVYVNDQRTFEVVKVNRFIQRESPLNPFIK